MAEVDQRAALDRLITERREDYAGLSRLIGRNPAYIQQFIKRGSPKRLSEKDRRILARYFGVDERTFGADPDHSDEPSPDMCRIARLDLSASAGPGSVGDGERLISSVSFDRRWLRRLCGARPEDLSIIEVEGDSMSPTLFDGDEIMVNISDSAGRLRDGIYVLRNDDALVVKRLAINPATRRATVKSDNPAYPLWPDCDLSELAIVGRVVWTARKVS
ncbi:MAG TPA: S24 family peptidase [Allosphingosinicella sp.]|jgi:hypothetical protein